MKKYRNIIQSIFSLIFLIFLVQPVSAEENEDLDDFDKEVLELAQNCAANIINQFDRILVSGALSLNQLFDSFYVPIPDTFPQKYNTQYDNFADRYLRPVLDEYQKKDRRIISVIVVDRNGYLPTHNTNFSQPLTGNREYDIEWNRTKRIFNDRTGLAAAHNREPYLLQKYSRDTGEKMSDLSVPLFLGGKHWGALRIMYQEPFTK